MVRAPCRCAIFIISWWSADAQGVKWVQFISWPGTQKKKLRFLSWRMGGSSNRVTPLHVSTRTWKCRKKMDIKKQRINVDLDLYGRHYPRPYHLLEFSPHPSLIENAWHNKRGNVALWSVTVRWRTETQAIYDGHALVQGARPVRRFKLLFRRALRAPSGMRS